MKWKTVAIVGAVLFLAGFLLGFLPEYQTASKLPKSRPEERAAGWETKKANPFDFSQRRLSVPLGMITVETELRS